MRKSFYCRTVYLHVSSHGATASKNKMPELNRWECHLIVLPEPPMLLGAIGMDSPPTQINDWITAMAKEAFKICAGRKLLLVYNSDIELVPHPAITRLSRQLGYLDAKSN